MATIIEALVTEHGFFCALFDQIEDILPGLGSAPEIKTLATVVEGLLSRHADAETNLAYVALDHALQEQGGLNRLHQDHKEIDAHFRRVHRAGSRADAGRLLVKALAATREHFRQEERSVFPLIERVLPAEELGALGEWHQRASSTAVG
jgi:hemerythrin-like domain-containing protein